MPSNSSSVMDIAARARCEELFLDFHRLIDEGNATRALVLFTRDPEPSFEVRGQRHVGWDAISQFLGAREQDTTRQTRHLASNFRFFQQAHDRAYATANLTVYHRGGEDGSSLLLEAVIDCELDFVRSDGDDWRVCSRRHSRFATFSH